MDEQGNEKESQIGVERTAIGSLYMFCNPVVECA